MQPIDALEYAKTNIVELQARMAQIDNPRNDDSWNFGKTPEQVAQKFLDDQGLIFTNVDYKAIAALISGGTQTNG